MELTERTKEEKEAYLDGYSAGEDYMQLMVFRILQKHLTHDLFNTRAEDIGIKIHQDIAKIPVQRHIRIRPRVIMDQGILTSSVDLEKNK